MPGSLSWSKMATIGLVIFGVFLGCGGVGMSSWAVGAVGVALIAAGIGLLVLPAMKGRVYSYSRGTAHVVNATEPPTSRAAHGRCHLHVVVHSATINGQSVKIRDNNVPIAKWPDAGMNLPIRVAIDDARKVEILWDEVPTHGSIAEQEARLREAPTAPLDIALVEEVEEEGAGYAAGDEGVEFDESPQGPAYAEASGYAEGDDGPAYEGVAVDEGDTPRPDDEPGDDGFDGRTRTYTPAEPYVPEDRPDDGSGLIPAGTTGRRVIELDVMDPSVMRWSTGSTGAMPTVPPPAADPPRRRPSPRPRPRPAVEEEAAASSVPVESMPEWPPPRPAASVKDFLAPEAPEEAPAAPEAPEAPEEVAEPAPAAAEGPFDQDALPTVTVPVGDPLDDPAVATAYMNATPPPDEQGRARVRNVALTVFVTDLSRSIIFYRDVLGFTEIDAGHGSTVLESGAARIVLRRVPMPPVERRVVHLLLEVPDVSAAYRDLVERGVTFVHRPRAVGQYDMMTLWAAALRDPDGHGIALTQWKPTRLG